MAMEPPTTHPFQTILQCVETFVFSFGRILLRLAQRLLRGSIRQSSGEGRKRVGAACLIQGRQQM